MKRIMKWIFPRLKCIWKILHIWFGKNQGSFKQKKWESDFLWGFRSIDIDNPNYCTGSGYIGLESYDRDPVTGELKGYVKEHYINGDYEYIEVRWK